MYYGELIHGLCVLFYNWFPLARGLTFAFLTRLQEACAHCSIHYLLGCGYLFTSLHYILFQIFSIIEILFLGVRGGECNCNKQNNPSLLSWKAVKLWTCSFPVAAEGRVHPFPFAHPPLFASSAKF